MRQFHGWVRSARARFALVYLPFLNAFMTGLMLSNTGWSGEGLPPAELPATAGREAATLLEFFRSRTLAEADRERLDRLVRQLGDGSLLRREQATGELQRVGATVLPTLRPALHHADLEIASRARRLFDRIEYGPGSAPAVAALEKLKERKPPGTLETLLAYLPFAEDDSVEEAVLEVLTALDVTSERFQAALLTALHDPLPIKRAAAAFVLARHPERGHDKLIYPLLAYPDAKVRFWTARGLLAGRNRAAVPVLVDLLVSAPEEIAWQAEEALQRLAGEKVPELPIDDGTFDARRKRREAWAAWWKEEGPSLDLGQRDGGAPLGLTVIAQMDLKTVWECGLDGKPRWQVNNLDDPIDAHVLPRGRVLIAEYRGQVITERDVKTGKVLWEKKVAGNPTVCQRLPNGNTFIATYHRVMEATRSGVELYAHSPDLTKGSIFAAQKLRNGHILCLSSLGWLQDLDSATGKVVKATQVTQASPYSIESLPGGRFLIANYNQNLVLEVDSTGKCIWQTSVPGAYHASRLANGNTLVASHTGRKVLEVNGEGKTVWEVPTNGPVWRVHRR